MQFKGRIRARTPGRYWNNEAKSNQGFLSLSALSWLLSARLLLLLLFVDGLSLPVIPRPGRFPACSSSSPTVNIPPFRIRFQTERDSGISSSKFPEEKSGSGQAGPRSEQATRPWKNAAPLFPPALSCVPLTFSH